MWYRENLECWEIDTNIYLNPWEVIQFSGNEDM